MFVIQSFYLLIVQRYYFFIKRQRFIEVFCIFTRLAIAFSLERIGKKNNFANEKDLL